jgi:hypothetical protein
VTSLEGLTIQSMVDLKLALAQYKAGEQITMAVERKGEPELLVRKVVLQ